MEKIAEILNPFECHQHIVKRVIHHNATTGEDLKILELENYGRCMVLSDRIQSTQYDESFYHESLIFPAYVFASTHKRVLSIGGANGGIVREILKFPDLAELCVVDVSEAATLAARTHLPHMFSHEPENKVKYLYNPSYFESLNTLSASTEKYDIIYSDLPDAFNSNDVSRLFTGDYFKNIGALLGNKGIYVTHAGHITNIKNGFYASVVSTLQNAFAHVDPYCVFMPSFGTLWIMIASSNSPLEPQDIHTVDRKIAQLSSPLNYYDGITHQHMFSLPKPFRTVGKSSLIHTGNLKEQY